MRRVALRVRQQAWQRRLEGDDRAEAFGMTHREIERDDGAEAAAEHQRGSIRHRAEHGVRVVGMPLDGHLLLRVVQAAARQARGGRRSRPGIDR